MTTEALLNFLRDGVWQFAGVFVGLVAIAASLFIYRRQTARKALACGLLSVRELLSVDEKIAGKLEIRFEDEPVRDVLLLLIGVRNAGNVAILRSDFDNPLHVALPVGAKLLRAETVDQHPSGLGVRLTTTPSSITVEPLLLNPDDSFSIQALVSGQNHEITIEARIVGVSKLQSLLSASTRRRELAYLRSAYLLFASLSNILYSAIDLIWLKTGPSEYFVRILLIYLISPLFIAAFSYRKLIRLFLRRQ